MERKSVDSGGEITLIAETAYEGEHNLPEPTHKGSFGAQEKEASKWAGQIRENRVGAIT